MSEPIPKRSDFDFTGIFPKCYEGFSWDLMINRLQSETQKFTALCSDFLNAVKTYPFHSNELIQYYRILSLYLHHIGNKINNENVEKCCKYFYYKLKKLLLDPYKCNCGGTDKCYEKMKKLERKNLGIQISDICRNHFIDIDAHTSKILERLDEIYNLIELFKNPLHREKNTFRSKQIIESTEKIISAEKNTSKETTESTETNALVGTSEYIGTSTGIVLCFLQ
ncbi:variable surface protein [Plasmodium gonderi]|uniref:Variable surface protein n=1 Tax=Plasmodium gonderi TaxID=77519 RepID=A0A1Y1JQ82_PLAGO|nr:variable surface protein [Plasmodium gonderi]GAW84579.1 variable surface protein [Plasmodium gonderi]